MRQPRQEENCLAGIIDQYFDKREACEEVHVTADGLHRYARKSKNSCARVDGWRGNHWSDLPVAVFEPLADIWNTALQGKKIPSLWKNIRTVMIPKDEKGMRPIAAASLGWRCGMGSSSMRSKIGSTYGRLSNW